MTETTPDHPAALRARMHEHWFAAGRPSYRALAQAAGTSHTTVQQFFTGGRAAPPAWHRVQGIAEALGVTEPAGRGSRGSLTGSKLPARRPRRRRRYSGA